MKWINFEDQQPEVGVAVLCHCPDAMPGYEYSVRRLKSLGGITPIWETIQNEEHDNTTNCDWMLANPIGEWRCDFWSNIEKPE